ncbi:NTP transferase domain-containing protein [Myxococcota bacterium]|nr:NTP transferase domain-containing protein [Myxococcota bacterium]
MIVYLLAAGYATRLWPLTRDRAKPLLEVGGVPLLTHLVRRFETLEAVEEIVVIGNSRFAGDLSNWARELDVEVRVRVLDDGTHSDQDKLGALGDLEFALKEIPPAGRDWAVAAGDNLIIFDLEPLHQVFQGYKEPLIALRKVEPSEGPSPYNEVTLGTDDQVIGFREKPVNPRTDLAAIALYFMPAGAEGHLGRYLEQGGERDAPGHWIAWLVEKTSVRGFAFVGSWYDIGSHETLAQARAHFTQEMD